MKVPKEVSRQREFDTWDLRQKCYTQARIAKQLNISQAAVSKILNKLSKKYSEELSEDVKIVKGEQVAQLEFVADEAMQAWEKSKKRHKRNCNRDASLMENSFAEEEESDQYGDPRYLNAAMKAKEDIRKIVGADSPLVSVNANLDMPESDAKSKLLERLIKAASAGNS